jgi:NADH-quinone oxidoreductase subunit M
MGIFALNVEGLQGSLMQMVNHGIITGGLFILLGYLYKRRHTFEIAELSGLQRVAPVFAGLFTLFMLASIGVPGLAGFVGEFLVLLGTFVAHRWWAVVAAAGVILAALYMLWAYQRVFHGEPSEANRSFPEIRAREVWPLVPLVALTFFIGLYPKPMLERMEPSLVSLVEHIENNVAGFESPTTQDGAELAPVAAERNEGPGDAEVPDGPDTAPADEGGGS